MTYEGGSYDSSAPYDLPNTSNPPAWHFLVATTGGGLSVLGELVDARSREMSWFIDQGCTAQFSIAGKSEWVSLINEVQTDLVCFRDDTGPQGTSRAWFRGRMGSSSDTIDEDTQHECQFAAGDYRVFLTDARTIWPGGATVFGNLDISDAVWELVAQTQALPFGDLHIARGLIEKTGVKVPFENPNNINNFPTFAIGDYIGRDIDTLSSAYPGFEYEIDASRRFNLWSPLRGSTTPVVLDYGGSVIKVERKLDTTKFANAIVATGSWTSETDVCSIWAGQTHILDPFAQAALGGYQVQGVGIPGDGSTTIASTLSARQLPPMDAVTGTGAWPSMIRCASTASTITFTFSAPAPISVGATFNVDGCSPSGFNGDWVAASAPGNVIHVTSSANPGSGGAGTPGDASANPGRITFHEAHGLSVGTIINLEFGNGLGFKNNNYFVSKVITDFIVELGTPNLPTAIPTNTGSAFVPQQLVLSVPATQTNDKAVLLLSVFKAIAQTDIGPEGRWERLVSDNTIVSKEILDAWAQEQAIDFAAMTPSYTCRIRPGWWDPNTLWIGDTCKFVCFSGRLQINEMMRVVQIDVTLPDDGQQEDVTITLNSRPATLKTRLRNYRLAIDNLSRR